MNKIQGFKKFSTGIALVLAGLVAGYVLFSGGHDHGVTECPDHAEAADEAEIAYWTCSMHPQIREDQPGSCPICAMALIPKYKEERTADDYSMAMSEAAVQLARIQTSPVIRGVPEKNIRLPGRIKVDERRITNVTAHFPGRIRTLHVDFTGAPIRKGEPMATIYSPELVGAQRELIEALNRRDRLPGMVEAARQKLRQWDLSEKQIADIEQRGVVETDIDILSPVDGFVLARNVSREQHVAEGTILYEVADLAYVWAVFEAYEEDIQWIAAGDTVRFRMRAQPGTITSATIDYIDPVMNPKSRTIGLRADIENNGTRLKPDMLLSGQISARLAEEKLMVPAGAVLWTGPRSIVFVMDKEADQPVFEAREVTLGQRSGDFFVVEEGVYEGEEVVSNGAFRVDSAFQLADRFSMMNREPGRGVVPVHDHGPADAAGVHDHDDLAVADDPADLKREVDAQFRGEFTALIHDYLVLKDALVASSLEAAKNAGGDFMQTLGAIGEHRMRGDAHMAWMSIYSNIESHGGPIADRNDLEQVRNDFRFLSDVIIDAVKTLGADDDFYHLFCPMAFGDEGGHWISDVPDIRNPYLPETMLRCGVVREKLSF